MIRLSVIWLHLLQCCLIQSDPSPDGIPLSVTHMTYMYVIYVMIWCHDMMMWWYDVSWYDDICVISWHTACQHGVDVPQHYAVVVIYFWCTFYIFDCISLFEKQLLILLHVSGEWTVHYTWLVPMYSIYTVYYSIHKYIIRRIISEKLI